MGWSCSFHLFSAAGPGGAVLVPCLFVFTLLDRRRWQCRSVGGWTHSLTHSLSHPRTHTHATGRVSAAGARHEARRHEGHRGDGDRRLEVGLRLCLRPSMPSIRSIPSFLTFLSRRSSLPSFLPSFLPCLPFASSPTLPSYRALLQPFLYFPLLPFHFSWRIKCGS